MSSTEIPYSWKSSARDALTDLLLRCVLQALGAGDEIKNVTVGDNLTGVA